MNETMTQRMTSAFNRTIDNLSTAVDNRLQPSNANHTDPKAARSVSLHIRQTRALTRSDAVKSPDGVPTGPPLLVPVVPEVTLRGSSPVKAKHHYYHSSGSTISSSEFLGVLADRRHSDSYFPSETSPTEAPNEGPTASKVFIFSKSQVTTPKKCQVIVIVLTDSHTFCVFFYCELGETTIR